MLGAVLIWCAPKECMLKYGLKSELITPHRAVATTASPPGPIGNVSRQTRGKVVNSAHILLQISRSCLCFSAYSLKLKFRPPVSVMGDEGPALDTALEGMLPSKQENQTQKSIGYFLSTLSNLGKLLPHPSFMEELIITFHTEPQLHLTHIIFFL